MRSWWQEPKFFAWEKIKALEVWKNENRKEQILVLRGHDEKALLALNAPASQATKTSEFLRALKNASPLP